MQPAGRLCFFGSEVVGHVVLWMNCSKASDMMMVFVMKTKEENTKRIFIEARHPGQRTGDVTKMSSRFGNPRWVDKHYSEVSGTVFYR